MSKKLLPLLAVCLLFVGFPHFIKGQSYSESQVIQKASLQSIAEELSAKQKKNYQQAIKLAKQRGWPIRSTDQEGRVLALKGLTETGIPIYYTTMSNIRSAATIGVNKVWSGGVEGLSLSGVNPVLRDKLAVWDGGVPRPTHQEYQGRISVYDGTRIIANHSTHVAGTMIAAGVNPLAKGMAWKANNLIASDFNNDNAEMAAAVAKYGLLLSNHSYGYVAGWNYNSNRQGTPGNPNWEWWGDAGESEDYKFGTYTADVADWDRIAFNAPYYLIVKAAGNNRGSTGPEVGESYYQMNNDGSFRLVPALEEGAISANDMYDNISITGNAKNILVVGAVEGLDNGYMDTSDVQMANFSSWGPTDDGRIKPDVVANGIQVLSSLGGSDSQYGIYSGTSMATPSVTGAALLLQEHYANLNANDLMRAATLKGLIIHTADEAGSAPGPDYAFGWGLMNTAKAAKVITDKGKYSDLKELTLNQAGVYEQKVIASGIEPLVVSISWTDPEAIPTVDGVVNSRVLKLVNDLDLRVSGGSTQYKPWILDPENPVAPAGNGDNFRDNIEHIFIENPIQGEEYTIRVTHKGTLRDNQQAFSLIVSGMGGLAYCPSAANATQGLKISTVKLGGKTFSSDNCSGTNKSLANPIGMEPGQQIPIEVTIGNCDGSTTGLLKVFIDWNNNGKFEDDAISALSNILKTGNVFSGNITVPVSVVIGDMLRMRLVLQETDQENAVQACGTFERGETEEYSIKILVPSNDITTTGLISPQSFDCADDGTAVSVNFKNSGTQAQSDIPVEVEVSTAGELSQKLQGVIPGPINGGDNLDYIFPEKIKTFPGRDYTIKLQSNLSLDQLPHNDAKTVSVHIEAIPTIELAGSFLRSDSELPGQWYFNGIAIDDATDATYTPHFGGTYTLMVQGCKKPSNAIVFKLAADQVSLIIFPVPARDQLTVEFNVLKPGENAELSIINTEGQALIKESMLTESGLFVKSYPIIGFSNGLYIVSLQIGSEIHTSKFLVNN